MRLEDHDSRYSAFTTATSDMEVQCLLKAWLSFKQERKIKGHKEILELLAVSRNNHHFTIRESKNPGKRITGKGFKPMQFTLRRLPDEKTLVVSCIDARTQIPVCWVGDCEDRSGDGLYLCCSKHEITYGKHLELKKSKESASKPECKDEGSIDSIGCAGVRATEYKDPLAHWKNPALRPLHKIIRIFTALGDEIWKNEPFFDPLISIDEKKRGILAERLNWNIYKCNNYRLTYDSDKKVFLFMDTTEDLTKWSPICREKGCPLLASDGSMGCFSHPDKPVWKDVYQQKLMELGNVSNVHDFGDTARDMAKTKIEKSPNKRIPIVDEKASFVVNRNYDIVVNCGFTNTCCICTNTGCLGLLRSGDLTRVCNDCKQMSVALLLFPDTGRVPIYAALKFSHGEMNRHERKAFDISSVIQNQIKKHRHVLRGELKGRYYILDTHTCEAKGDAGVKEANAWQTAYVMYGKLEGILLSRRAKFSNAVCHITDQEWAVFEELCRKRSIKMELTDEESNAPQPPQRYKLITAEPDFQSNDYTKTVYKIATDSLVYIGQRTIFANSGRAGLISSKCHLVEPARLKSREIIRVLQMKGLDSDGDQLPNTTVAVITDASLSPFVPETMIMMAYTLNEQRYKKTKDQLVNKSYSSTEWTDTWFDEFRYIFGQLFGGTIKLVGCEKLSIENSLLFASTKEQQSYKILKRMAVDV